MSISTQKGDDRNERIFNIIMIDILYIGNILISSTEFGLPVDRPVQQGSRNKMGVIS